MVSKLELYTLNGDGNVAPFPSESEHILLYDFTYEAQRMGGAPEITSTIQHDGTLEEALSTDVFCEYNGERYYLKHLPSSSKNNEDVRHSYELTFVAERAILDNVYMVDAVQDNNNPDSIQSSRTNVVFMGDISHFVARLNAAMDYLAVGYTVVVDEGISSDEKLVSLRDKYFTEALQEGVNLFNIPYYFVGKVIHFGWAQTYIPTLEYGNGLLGITKDLRNKRIINRATATGSSENIPYYYPNPTPRGEIKVTQTNPVMSLVVDNYYKASKIPEGATLAYRTAGGKIDLFSYYHYALSPYDQWDAVADYESKEQDGVVYGGEDRSLFFVGIQTYDNPPTDINIDAVFNTNITDVKYPEIEINGLQLYEDNTGLFLDKVDADVSYESDYKYGKWGKDGNVKISLKIKISNIPANSVRFLRVELHRKDDTKGIPVSFAFDNDQDGYKAGWYIKRADGVYGDLVSLSDYGMHISEGSMEEGEIGIEVVKKLPPTGQLMPSIYRETDGQEFFYNAVNNKYPTEDGGFVQFENEYSPANPKEAITSFDNIKPTITGVINSKDSGEQRIDMFADIAFDLTDSDETEEIDSDTKSYIHPYFYVKLRKTDGDEGFNLFGQAIEQGEMTIEMTTGDCGACKFVIAVDSNTQRNLVLVDDNGDLIYDEATGKVKMATDAKGLDQQNDTRYNEVWVALKKDINTYGQIMPNVAQNQKPKIGDTFIITNILLPTSYFQSAEKKLEAEIIKYLLDGNSYQYDFSINLSRIYLKNNVDTFDQLNENAQLNILYNNKVYTTYVESYTYRKNKGELLPDISVSLTDSFESTPSVFGQTISSVKGTVQAALDAIASNLAKGETQYIRKDIPDSVMARLSFNRGFVFSDSIESKGFRKGEVSGQGFAVYVDEAGYTVVETDRMIVRSETSSNLPFVYDSVNKVWEFQGDLVTTGAITMFGSLAGFKPSTIMDAVQVDGRTIVKNAAGQLVAIGGGGSSAGGGGLIVDDVNALINAALVPYALKESIPTNNTQLVNSAGYITGSALNGYATEQWVSNQGYAKQSSLDGVDNRLKSVETFFATSDTDNLVNKWSEIVTFLNATEGDTLDNILKTKANQSALDDAVASLTTEIGKKWTQDDAKISNWDTAYSWGNHANAGYAGKSYVDTEFAKYVKLATAQSISAQHNFTSGLKINGLPITKASDGTLYIDANVVVSGALTMFGNGSTTFPTIWANIPFDSSMRWDGSKWSVVGGSGGGVDVNAVNTLINEALVGYAKQSWVQSQGYLTTHQSLSHLLTKTDAANTYQTIINSTNKIAYSNISGTPDLSVYALKTAIPSLSGYATEQWVGNNYLAKSGGSVSSDDYQPLFVNSNFSSGIEDVRIAIAHNWNVKGLFNWESNGVGLRMYNTACGSAIGIKDDGTPYYDSYELIHLGNIGSYNAGSATKLQTPRTIWGQSFDGTGNVYGSFYTTDNIFLNSGGEGIYISANSISWHNSSNGWTNSLLGFIADGTVVAHNKLAIGGTTADYKLHIHGVGGFNDGLWAQGIRLERTDEINSYGSMGGTGNGNLYLNYRSSGIVSIAYGGGNVSIGKVSGGASASAQLHVHGDILADSAITMFSQASLKNIVDERGLSLDELATIKPTRFYWKDGRDDKLHVGGIADDVIKVLPEAIYHTSDGTMTMDYGSAAFFIGASLIKPVLDHEKRIADLENENKRKDKIIISLQNKLKQLTA